MLHEMDGPDRFDGHPLGHIIGGSLLYAQSSISTFQGSMAHDRCGPQGSYMQARRDSFKSVYECLRGTPTVFHKKPRNGVELVKQLALRRFSARGGWRSRRGADTVQLTPASAGNSAMLRRQRVLPLRPTRNRSACPSQKEWPSLRSRRKAATRQDMENAHFSQRRRHQWCIIPPIAGCYGSEGHTAKCTAALL